MYSVIGTQIDHLFSCSEELGDNIHGGLVGDSGEEKIRSLDERFHRQIFTMDINSFP